MLKAQRKELKRRQARQAAQALGQGSAAGLDLTLLLRDLSADADVRWICFMLPDGQEIAVTRQLLRRVGVVARRRKGSMKASLRAWVDSDGLQLRWATGWLTLRSLLFDSKTTAPMLRVSFSQRVQEAS